MRDPIYKWTAPAPQGSSSGMMWLVSNMFLIPLRTFVYGMEMIVDAMRGLRDAGDRGMEVIAGGEAAAAALVTESYSETEVSNSSNCTARSGTEELNEETTKMDQTLNNDKVKLVRYEILSLERGDERVLGKKGEQSVTELVTDNIEDSAYIAWKIAQHCKDNGKDLNTYGKSLRVHFEVLDSYEREDLKFEEKQLHVLGEIRDNIGGAASKVS